MKFCATSSHAPGMFIITFVEVGNVFTRITFVCAVGSLYWIVALRLSRTRRTKQLHLTQSWAPMVPGKIQLKILLLKTNPLWTCLQTNRRMQHQILQISILLDSFQTVVCLTSKSRRVIKIWQHAFQTIFYLFIPRSP